MAARKDESTSSISSSSKFHQSAGHRLYEPRRLSLEPRQGGDEAKSSVVESSMLAPRRHSNDPSYPANNVSSKALLFHSMSQSSSEQSRRVFTFSNHPAAKPQPPTPALEVVDEDDVSESSAQPSSASSASDAIHPEASCASNVSHADPRMEEVIRRFRKHSTEEQEIMRSRRGTILGYGGGVASRRMQFLKQTSNAATSAKSLAEQLEESEAKAGEENGGKLVVYVTSVQAVKETYSACQEIRKILQRARVAFEERDISMDSKFNKELAARLSATAKVPQLFLNGKYVGDFELVHQMNEGGVFQQIIESLPKLPNHESSECADCGGKGFFTCTWCGGSKKSISNRFGRSIVSLKCTACNENGLMRCQTCATQSFC